MIFRSLRTKFIVGSVALVLLVGAALVTFILVDIHDRLEKEVYKRAFAIARHLAEAAITPILTENQIKLQLLVNDYLKNEEDLRYIYVINNNKEVLAHTFGNAFPDDLIKLYAHTEGDKTGRLVALGAGEGLVYDMPAMIQHGDLGQVHIGISEAVIRKNQHDILNQLFLYVSVILCLGVVVAILFASTITRPIAILAAGVRQVGRGKLMEGIDIGTSDEIGQLAKSFNAMTENLRQTTVSREFMDKIINTMNDALAVISPDGIIKSVNRAYGDLFGYDPAQLPGRRVDEFDDHEAPQLMYGAFGSVFQKGRVPSYESICRRSSGELVPVLFSLAAMYDEQGSIEAVICAAQDISTIKGVQKKLEQKQAELEDLNRSLEDMVACRTNELAITNRGLLAEMAEHQRTTEELRLARDAAEKANRAKTDFLANMSHEMRTPLNSIIGGAEYLAEASLTSDQGRCLDMIRQAGNNLLALVNDLIDLSRIEAGRMELLPRDFCLKDILEHTLSMLSGEARSKKLELALDLDAGLPRMLIGDEIRLQQVLVNLLANAIKFTFEGSVRISAIGGSQKDDLIPVTFEVRDTGIGIEESKLEMIFETFTQADSSITRKYGGSGLGLAISRKLVETMGGHLRVASKVGVGSQFGFTIPLRVSSGSEISDKAEKPAQAKSEVPGSPVAANDDSLPLVLLVDDSLDNRRLLRLLLVRKHLNIHEASNGSEAQELFEKNAYALVLMDIQMPVMDGYTATRLLRQMEQKSGRARTPVIALTAHDTEDDIRACLEAGCDDHISKPFKKEALFECLSRYIRLVS
ncbi:MAG: hypothetical protein CXR30_17495 [Geobacter sp.]|nr:MAG: hypothetical protein CXR30_17495 [Geobacter sp.]